MANKPKHMKPTDEAMAEAKIRFETSADTALARVKAEKAAEEKKKNLLYSVHSVGVDMGQAKAFQGMALMADFLKCKALQRVADNKETLEIMGFTSIDAYFEAAGIGESQGFRNLKIARTFTVLEVQFFGQIGLRKKDLLGLASLPADKRPRLVDGRLENYETADPEELKEVIEGLVVEHKKVSDEVKGIQKSAERVQKSLNDKINEYEHKYQALEVEAKLRSRTPEADAFIKKMENMKTHFDGFYMLNIDPARIQIDVDNDPQHTQAAAYITSLQYMKMKINAAFDTACDQYADVTMLPEEGWHPGMKA